MADTENTEQDTGYLDEPRGYTMVIDGFDRNIHEVPDGFVALRNTATNGVTFVPDAPGVIEHHEALGWSRVDDEQADEDEPPARRRTAKKTTNKPTPEAGPDSADASA